MWVWRRHGPVANEWCTGCEEGDFCCEPADADVYREVEDQFLDLETKCEASVHKEHADFYDVDYVQHCLWWLVHV